MFAFNLVFEQFKDTKRTLNVNFCTSTLTKTLGIIYKHIIQSIVWNGGVLTIGDFHSQYHLVNITNLLLLLPKRHTFVLFNDLQMVFDIISCSFELLPIHQQERLCIYFLELALMNIRLENPLSINKKNKYKEHLILQDKINVLLNKYF